MKSFRQAFDVETVVGSVLSAILIWAVISPEPGGAIAPAAHRAGDPSDWSPSVSSKAAIDYRKGESE